VTAQAIRIITEKVMENVAKQIRQQQPDSPALLNSPPDVMSVLAGMHQQLVQTQAALASVSSRLEELESEVTSLNSRAASIESRWGWKLWAAIVGAVFLAFGLGLVTASVLRLFG